ncbi:hypothetical protein F4823DRAFT_602535 [Ustulina deusta]|nr:hypothetical protein F4823DRAFT_602535 [Ustulina deusta]
MPQQHALLPPMAVLADSTVLSSVQSSLPTNLEHRLSSILTCLHYAALPLVFPVPLILIHHIWLQPEKKCCLLLFIVIVLTRCFTTYRHSLEAIQSSLILN